MAAEDTPAPAGGRSLGAAFERRVLVLAPGGRLAYDSAHWAGALVVVAQGRVALEELGGRRSLFGPGAVLWLERLPLRALHNDDARVPAILVAVARRAGDARR